MARYETPSRETSVKGVRCHQCREYIRKEKVYYKMSWPGRNYMEYRNFCVKCFPARASEMKREIESELKELDKWLTEASNLAKEYDTTDRLICETCKWRMKHITDQCEPKRNCRYVERSKRQQKEMCSL